MPAILTEHGNVPKSRVTPCLSDGIRLLRGMVLGRWMGAQLMLYARPPGTTKLLRLAVVLVQ
jgi:hypothetical protein